MIKSFSITGLFGDRDVIIPFDSNVKILVAENGTGKTTVLNSLYNTVSGEFFKLRGLDFEKISLTFIDDTSVEITRQQIEALDSILMTNPGINQFVPRFGTTWLQSLIDIIRTNTLTDAVRQPAFRNAAQRIGWPPDNVYNYFKQFLTQPQQPDAFSLALKAARETIAKGVTHQLLYFPTYRRIEEDLERLGFAGQEFPAAGQLIKFGMNDVLESFQKITNEIKNSSIEWFSRINGQMLTQLVDGINVTPDMRKIGIQLSLRQVCSHQLLVLEEKRLSIRRPYNV